MSRSFEHINTSIWNAPNADFFGEKTKGKLASWAGPRRNLGHQLPLPCPWQRHRRAHHIRCARRAPPLRRATWPLSEPREPPFGGSRASGGRAAAALRADALAALRRCRAAGKLGLRSPAPAADGGPAFPRHFSAAAPSSGCTCELGAHVPVPVPSLAGRLSCRVGTRRRMLSAECGALRGNRAPPRPSAGRECRSRCAAAAAATAAPP